MPRTRKYYRVSRTCHKKEYIPGRATDIIKSALGDHRNVFAFEITRMSISDDATIEQVRDKGLLYIARANDGKGGTHQRVEFHSGLVFNK